MTLPGGMAQFVAVPEKAAFDIGALPFNTGAFVEPLSCVLHGVQRTGFSLADRVLILGAGPIGILLLKAILLEGASSITSVDKNEARLALAHASGAVQTVSSLRKSAGDGFDVVVDATGVPAVMEKTLAFARSGAGSCSSVCPAHGKDQLRRVHNFPQRAYHPLFLHVRAELHPGGAAP